MARVLNLQTIAPPEDMLATDEICPSTPSVVACCPESALSLVQCQ